MAEKCFLCNFLCYVVPLIENIYYHWNEASESENENSSETSEQNETTCRYAHCEILNFTKIRITLPFECNAQILAREFRRCFLYPPES